MTIAPFRIDVPQADLDDLTERLQRTRWADVMEGVGWTYGADDGFMHDLIASWRSFDWRAREAELNRFPQFKAEVDGEGVHFVHVRGSGPRPAPLILTHGWPSSFPEYLGLVGPLSDPAAFGGDPADAFDVIVPSLPGYGFSDRPSKPGMTPRRIAELWVKLMAQLGYERFGAHGCDWGSYVTSLIGLDHPGSVLGVHMGTVSLGVQREASPAKTRSPAELERARARRRWVERETGYSILQGTKPQTLAYGLSDSPAGLAAWIGEKWRAWNDRSDPRCAIPRDALLTNIAIYWFSRTLNSSARLYYESRANPVRLSPGERVAAPSGFFLETPPGERNRPPGETTRTGGAARAKAEEAFNVQRWFEAPRGGHFPALETPDLLIDELRAFFRPLRPVADG